jgi:hypothetical protein
VGYHFLKGGPQSALAANPGESSADVAASSDQTPTEALAALDPSRDPTRDLLLRAAALPSDLLTVPRNPFKISDVLHAQIIKPRQAAAKAAEPHVEPTRIIEEPRPVAETLKATDFKLAGIIRRDTQLVAIINGHFLAKGEIVGKARVVDIQDDHVTLRHKDWPDGPETVLTIDPDK